jgi:hypothetical protein
LARKRTKHERRLERSESVAVERIRSRRDITLAVVPRLGKGGLVGMLYFPLQAIEPMVEDLAGKSTDVTTSFSFTVAISVVVTGAYFNQRIKNGQQKRELQRLRARLEARDAQDLQRSGE